MAAAPPSSSCGPGGQRQDDGEVLLARFFPPELKNPGMSGAYGVVLMADERVLELPSELQTCSISFPAPFQ